MPTLSYGLNVPKKSQKGLQPQASKAKPIFDDDSDQDEDKTDGPQAIENLEDLSKPMKSPVSEPSAPGRKVQRPRFDVRFGDLAASHSASKHAASAQEVDPSIYDYDAVYDSLHSKPIKKKEPTGPKYMKNLLDSAETRKRDQLRAKEKMLAKEREAEGDEYADKEKFVTAAYRAQQEEMKRLEEEERKREEQAAARRQREGGGMKGLYKDMLAREDARHEAINQALEANPETVEAADDVADELNLAKETGATVNEEGQVVDKRQLLKAGLNVISKPKPLQNQDKPQTMARSHSMNLLQGTAGSKAAMRERQSRMIEEQLEQAAKRAAEDDAVEQEAVKRASKSQKTGEEIQSARERYLQRKQEAAAAKSAKGEPR